MTGGREMRPFLVTPDTAYSTTLSGLSDGFVMNFNACPAQ